MVTGAREDDLPVPPLAVGSGAGEPADPQGPSAAEAPKPETEEERKARLLARPRSEVTQRKFSQVHHDKFAAAVCWRREWPIDLKAIDELNDLVVLKAETFSLKDLARLNYKKLVNTENQDIDWIRRMNDRNIHKRHLLFDVIDRIDGGPWRLFEQLPTYAEPWVTYSKQEVLEEYKWDYRNNCYRNQTE